jgi:hypothetical protein
MQLYQKPVTQEQSLYFSPLFTQYGLTPICDTDLSRECESGGGTTGFSCSDGIVNITVFIEGASLEDSFPCKILIDGASSPFNLDGSGDSDTCGGEPGVVYFVDVEDVNCNELESVKVSCDTTVDCLDID